MERETVKRATAAAKKTAAKSTRLCEALGTGTDVEIAGRTWRVQPLTLNDLVMIEERWETADEFFSALVSQRAVAIRWWVWLMLRQVEPDLTLDAVGALLPLDVAELTRIIEDLVEAAGLQKKVTEAVAASE